MTKEMGSKHLLLKRGTRDVTDRDENLEQGADSAGHSREFAERWPGLLTQFLR